MEDGGISPKKKHILMVHNFYQIGGGEHTVFENEKRLLKEHGYHVEEYTRDNAEINHSLRKKMLLPLTTIFSIKTYRDIKRIICENNIDLVHCHNTFPLISPSVYYAAHKCGVPVIQTIHNFRFICANGVLSRDGKPCEECLEKGLNCALSHKCYRESWLQTFVLINMLRIHRLIGTYRKIRYIFLTDFNRKKFRLLLGDWLDCQFTKPNFEYVEFSSQKSDRGCSFVYAGRLERDKGIDFLLNAWKEEEKRDLYIFGDGALQKDVAEASRNNSKIHFMGFQPKKIVMEYLQKSKAMIFASDLYEGFPMTIIESFAMGTPVVCSDIGNGADIVCKHNAGVVYTARNIDSLRDALKRVEERFDEYSKRAREAYEDNYTPENNYKQLITIYEEVINEQ